MKCGRSDSCHQDNNPDLADALQTLIVQSGDPARVLECYYWSQEPGLVECIRALLTMPADARAALQAFLAAAVVRESITVQIDAAGTLSLQSPEAASILTTFFRSCHSSTSSRLCN